MELHTVKLELVKEVTRDFLDDVLVTAFDSQYGGCWYWAKPAGRGWIQQDCGTEEQTWSGVEITWEEREEEGMDPVVVDHALLVTGIQRILDSKDIRKQIKELMETAVFQDDAGDVDADLADTIVQYALFGEGVYG